MTSIAPDNSGNASARLLVVDDEEIVLLSLSETLSREGYQVTTSRNPLEALDLLRQEFFSVVLSDQRMPQMAGLEFLDQVKQIQGDTTRMLMTGLVDLSTVIKAINTGEIYRFIVKPWIREELLMAVRNAVQRHELISQNAMLQRNTEAMNEKLAELNQSLEQQVAREALQNRDLATLNLALKQNLHQSVELCLKTMQTFYPGMGVQARMVFELCKAIADGLELPQDQREVLEISAWLHDIGLVGVPRRLIRLWQKAPEALSAAERATLQQHTILGQELVGFLHPLEGVGAVIRAHHERFDGKGYPDGLAGEEIPWLGRLLAVVANYVENDDEQKDALEMVRRGSGAAFDPEAVRAFCRFRPRAFVPKREREILLSEMSAGMVLAKGIYTANGLLLMPEGQILNEMFIDKLRNHNRVNPIKQSLIVYC